MADIRESIKQQTSKPFEYQTVHGERYLTPAEVLGSNSFSPKKIDESVPSPKTNKLTPPTNIAVPPITTEQKAKII